MGEIVAENSHRRMQPFIDNLDLFMEPLPRIPPPDPNTRDAEKPRGAIRLIPQDWSPSEQHRLTADKGSISHHAYDSKRGGVDK